MVIPVSSSTPNSTARISSGVGDPHGHPVRQRAADGEADEARRALARCRVDRRPGPQMPQAQHGQATMATPSTSRGRASGWGSVRIRTTRDRGDQQGQQNDGSADEGAQHRVDPGAHRPGGVEPGGGGDHDRQRQQTQSDAVAAVTRLDVAGAAHRARRGARARGPASARSPAPRVRRRPRSAPAWTARCGPTVHGGARQASTCAPGPASANGTTNATKPIRPTVNLTGPHPLSWSFARQSERPSYSP